MKSHSLALLAFTCLVSSCFFGGSRPDQNDLIPMVTLQSTGQSAVLGDQNQTVITFAYDFQISSHEITIQNFLDAVGNLPNAITYSKKTANQPISQVSMYDAIRFCNAMSISEGLDTVYH